MKPIKAFGLVALATLMVMALAGAGSAMAGPTALCNVDPGTGSEEECPSGHLVTHLHETTLAGAKAKLLTSVLTVECDVLFLGDTFLWELASPLVIHGNYTYSNCSSGCTVAEENGPAEVIFSKLGHEGGSVIIEDLVHMECGAFINCRYSGFLLGGFAYGPLLSIETNGEVLIIQQTMTKETGALCPNFAKLDLVTTPLSATYLTN